MPTKMLTLVVVASVLLAICVEPVQLMKDTLANRLAKCVQETGNVFGDIIRAETRNHGCSLECITQQEASHTHFYEDGESCGNPNSGYRCHMFQCRNKSEIMATRISRPYNVRLAILNAHVPERPFESVYRQESSFVTVEIFSDGDPSYSEGEVFCQTPTIMDSSNPEWNFTCYPHPMKKNQQLKFKVYDKKLGEGDFLLGETSLQIDEVWFRGPQKLKLWTNDPRQDNKNSNENPRRFLAVEITGFFRDP